MVPGSIPSNGWSFFYETTFDVLYHTYIRSHICVVIPSSMDPRPRQPCWCDDHDGVLLTYYERQKCAKAQLAPKFTQRITNVESSRLDFDYGDSSDNGEDDDIEPEYSRQLDEVEVLCIRLFGNMSDHNSTQDSVTDELQTWTSTLGHHLPSEILGRIPRTYKQLRGLFRHRLLPFLRMPVCPGCCSMLEDVKASVLYQCPCGNFPFRRLHSGNSAAKREFLFTPLSDVVRSWYVTVCIGRIMCDVRMHCI